MKPILVAFACSIVLIVAPKSHAQDNDVQDPGLKARLEGLGDVEWDTSLLQNTRCPFLRAAAAAGKLEIENGKNLQNKAVLVADVGSIRKIGRDIGGVLAFFARFNHTRGLHPGQKTQFAGFFPAKDTFNLDQRETDNISDGTHDGTVDIIDGTTGLFTAAVVEEISKIAEGAPVLTPETMAKVIVASNRAEFSKVSGNKKGTVVDLAKSAGEWALMFCLLEDANGNLPIADLEALCRHARVPERGWNNLGNSGRREWVHFTTAITAHIAVQCSDGDPDVATHVMNAMHDTWCKDELGVECGCDECTVAMPGFWDNARQSIRVGFEKLRGARALLQKRLVRVFDKL